MRQTQLRSLPVAKPTKSGFCISLYSGIRHNSSRVHNRLRNVSDALRKRNYHLGWNGMYRMDTKVFSGRSAGLESRDSLRTSHQLAIDIALAAAHLPGGRFKCPQPRAIDAHGWYTG